MTSRNYFYCRVSTTEQTTENQITAFEKHGFKVNPSLVVSETIGGSTHAMERPLFKNLVENKLIAGDTLTVLKLDRLGRDAVDIQKTISFLLDSKIKVVCLDLPVSDLSTPEGKLMLQMFSAFAEFELNKIRERTKQGLERARKEGKQLGRQQQTDIKHVAELRNKGYSIKDAADALKVSESTIKLATKKAKELGLIKTELKNTGKKVKYSVDEIVSLRNKGLSISAMAKELGCSAATITNAVKKAKETGLILM